MKFEDEAEIDEWFSDTTRDLLEVYEKAVGTRKEEAAKARFIDKHKKLLARYHKAYALHAKRLERRKRLWAPYMRLKKWFFLTLETMQNSWRDYLDRRKKNKFEKEYAKLMKNSRYY